MVQFNLNSGFKLIASSRKATTFETTVVCDYTLFCLQNSSREISFVLVFKANDNRLFFVCNYRNDLDGFSFSDVCSMLSMLFVKAESPFCL